MLSQSYDRFTREIPRSRLPNIWDLIAFTLVIGVIVVLGIGANGMRTPYQVGEMIPIHLEPSYLPYYALRSVLRMLIALLVSLLLTFIFGTWAAKSRRAESLIISSVDVLQSVPVLSFLAITAPFFTELFPGSLLGPECAAIIAIISSQAWNMILSFYQSVRTVPVHLQDISHVFRLSVWQRFWRVEVPYAMPGLLWNMMVSMSASWFFVVASEAITVSNQLITLPGIGSYIALAIEHKDLQAVFYAIFAMFLVIMIYDQLLFKPLHQWSHRFRVSADNDDRGDRAVIANLVLRTKKLRTIASGLGRAWDAFVNFPSVLRWRYWPRLSMPRMLFSRSKPKKAVPSPAEQQVKRKFFSAFIFHPVFHPKLITVSYYLFLVGSAVIVCGMVAQVVLKVLTWHEMLMVCWLGAITGVKVMVLILLCSMFWVPIGVYIGMRPRLSAWSQPAVQFLAAFPANLLFPLAVFVIVKYHINADIGTAPLMVLGTQWYILFNVIAGTEALPKQLLYVASDMGLTGWLWWRRLMLPAILPYFVTGAMAAAGGAWNASILAEVVTWGNVKVEATGLGAYITTFYESGDFYRVIWGTVVMCFYVLLINHLLWQPLYHYAEERFQID